MTNLHEGHRQRLKDRAIAEGLDSFNAHQIIELLLFRAIGRRDTDELAHRLTERFGTVYGVLHASKEALMSVDGIGGKTAEYLCRVGALCDNYAALRFEDREVLNNAGMIQAYAERLYSEKPINSVWQLCLSPRGGLQTCAKVCEGLEWGAPSYLRRCVLDMAAVCARNAVIVILSPYDVDVRDGYDARIARDYAYMLSMMEAELIDVLIVGRDATLSLDRLGLYDRKGITLRRSVLSENYDTEESFFNENDARG